MPVKTEYKNIASFITKDGSIIRELMHPSQHGVKNQSLAEAIVPSGVTTQLHRHPVSEELYYILEGQGLMTLGDQRFHVGVGDTVCIRPGTAHQISANGDTDLRFLCCCSPAYSHDDTELLKPE